MSTSKVNNIESDVIAPKKVITPQSTGIGEISNGPKQVIVQPLNNTVNSVNAILPKTVVGIPKKQSIAPKSVPKKLGGVLPLNNSFIDENSDDTIRQQQNKLNS